MSAAPGAPVPEREKFKGTTWINPACCHTLQAPLGLRTGSKSRRPSGGGWTFIPAPVAVEGSR